MGATQEDIDTIEEEIMLRNNNEASATGNILPRSNKFRASGQPQKTRIKSKVSGAGNKMQNKGGKSQNGQNKIFNVNSSNEKNEGNKKSEKQLRGGVNRNRANKSYNEEDDQSMK